VSSQRASWHGPLTGGPARFSPSSLVMLLRGAAPEDVSNPASTGVAGRVQFALHALGGQLVAASWLPLISPRRLVASVDGIVTFHSDTNIYPGWTYCYPSVTTVGNARVIHMGEVC